MPAAAAEESEPRKQREADLAGAGVSYVRILSGLFLSNATYQTFLYALPSDQSSQIAWTWAVGVVIGVLAIWFEVYSRTTARLRTMRQDKERDYIAKIATRNARIAAAAAAEAASASSDPLLPDERDYVSTKLPSRSLNPF